MKNTKIPIRSWKQFVRKVRSKNYSLLKRLDDFPNSILVTGCQRSGTTMLTRIITQSDGMVKYWFGKDDELDAALILAGIVNHEPHGRYCFQTTYLNECYYEYFRHLNGHKIIWVLRHPNSVVYSMLYNWNKYALNQLFLQCGKHLLNENEKKKFRVLGKFGLTRLKAACYAYAGKTQQAFKLNDRLSPNTILFIDYDHLIQQKDSILPAIYDFIGLNYKDIYSTQIHRKSLSKSDNLSKKEKLTIDKICIPLYKKAKSSLLAKFPC